MTRYGFSIVIFIIAFFLGPRFEISVAQSTSLMSGDWTRIVEYPIAVALGHHTILHPPLSGRAAQD